VNFDAQDEVQDGYQGNLSSDMLSGSR
jgi:hypothetical protein